MLNSKIIPLALAAVALTACQTTSSMPNTTEPPAAATAPTTISSNKIVLNATQTQSLKGAISARLKDPSSAQYRGIRAQSRTLSNGKNPILVCGEVNSKNSLGGYAGFTPFSAVIVNGQVDRVDIASNTGVPSPAMVRSLCSQI